MPPRIDLLQGSLDLLILRTLALGTEHGWGVGQRIQERSEGMLDVNQGSLYPALVRLEQRGLIRSEWASTENNRRAKYYSLTAAGRRALAAETESWKQYAVAVDLILNAAR